MKGVVAVVAAGGTFAGTVVVATVIGIALDHRFGRSDLVVYAFFAGLLLGGYAAWRLAAQAILQ
jgi:hypothetical protein